MVPSVVVVAVLVVVVAGVVSDWTAFQAAQLVEKWDVRLNVVLWCSCDSVRRAARAADEDDDGRETRVRDDEGTRHARNMTVAVEGFILTVHLEKRKTEHGMVEGVV